jgi:hypothetical protein
VMQPVERLGRAVLGRDNPACNVRMSAVFQSKAPGPLV